MRCDTSKGTLHGRACVAADKARATSGFRECLAFEARSELPGGGDSFQGLSDHKRRVASNDVLTFEAAAIASCLDKVRCMKSNCLNDGANECT